MPVNVFGDDGDDVWGGVFGEVFFSRERITGAAWAEGDVYNPGFMEGQSFLPEFKQGAAYKPGFKQGQAVQ